MFPDGRHLIAEEGNERVRRLIDEGMAPDLAVAQVLGEGVSCDPTPGLGIRFRGVRGAPNGRSGLARVGGRRSRRSGRHRVYCRDHAVGRGGVMVGLLTIGDISGRPECRSRPSDGLGRARPCGYGREQHDG
jgi:hypothetical protein